METGQAETSQSDGRERRVHTRYPVEEEATILVRDHNQLLRCRVVDLSLEGCRIHSQDQMRLASGMQVEIAFRVNGIAFRFGGAIQWSDRRHEAGICFPSQDPRQARELGIALAELELSLRHKMAAAEFANGAAPGGVGQGAGAASAAPARRFGQERRAQAREHVDTSALIFLVKGGVHFTGRIVDLSFGGCCIRVADSLPLGIYIRVELEFRLRGLPFRLAGVIQSRRDQHSVGIRFLDVSERKQQQVAELMAEIEATHAAQPDAERI